MTDDRLVTVDTLQKALAYPGQDGTALIARVPLICKDIRDINDKLESLDRKTDGFAAWRNQVIGGLIVLGVLFIPTFIMVITIYAELKH